MASRKRSHTSTAASGIRLASHEEKTPPKRRRNVNEPDSMVAGVFNDPSISDLTLCLSPDDSLLHDLGTYLPSVELHVTSAALRRSGYFNALLSDRWQSDKHKEAPITWNLTDTAVPQGKRNRPFDGHVSVVRLLHTLDFRSVIRSPTDALDLLPLALEIIFDDLINFCLRFLDSVPWTEEEETRVLEMVPTLQIRESKSLLSRIFPAESGNSNPEDPSSPSDEMLHQLIRSAMNAPTSVKTFVGKILREHPSAESTQKVLDRSFLETLESFKDLIAKYVNHNNTVNNNGGDRESIQRLHLHSATNKMKHLDWVIELLVDMKMAEFAVMKWSCQHSLGSYLQKALKDDNVRNTAPALPDILTKSTLRLADEIVSGRILVSQKARTDLIKVWLPVLNKCKDGSGAHMSTSYELEKAFLEMISTLEIRDGQDLLQQCLCFATRRNIDECGHLVSAFKKWFTRAARSQIPVQVPRPELMSGFLNDSVDFNSEDIDLNN